MKFEGQNNESISIKDKYLARADSDGYVLVGEFATRELRRQTKSIAGFLDGEVGTEDYNLGEKLRYKGDSGNYSDMKIHIDDLETFIKRVEDYYS